MTVIATVPTPRAVRQIVRSSPMGQRVVMATYAQLPIHACPESVRRGGVRPGVPVRFVAEVAHRVKANAPANIEEALHAGA